MGLYEKYLLPRLTHLACQSRPAMRQREKVVPLATGKVLEIGIGSGLNLPYYREDQVQHIWGLDPSRELWALAETDRKPAKLDIEFLGSPAESIPLDNHCADTVLVTYTLCTIPDIATALAEVRRVLKPAGQLIFCEHGAAPDRWVRRFQDALTPAWRRVGGGCHLNLEIPALLQAGGFRIRTMDSSYIMGWKPVSFNYWGIAKPG